ncbi:hypothetical protein AGMMS49965_17600 [Bacteroidia bacterium]|nr:hypothetical protein AGMMS4957_14570 [Bacteroidia bacterium]GHT43568.1 hypothetical protein AGMMS49965_17600 [Bacteroidia bacterium]
MEDTLNECLILVDNSNIFIEGGKFAAKKKGIPAASPEQVPIDFSWRIDFGALLREVANGHTIVKAILVGSTPPPNDSLWGIAQSRGFEVIKYERAQSGEKAVDTQIVASGLKVIYKHDKPAILKLLSGDRDFVPLINCAYEEGWETELWGFRGSISTELAMTVNRVKELDPVFDKIGKYAV